MTAPNIANISSIVGLNTFFSGIGTNTTTVFLTNSAASNKVLRVNTLMASNTSTTSSSVTVKIFDAVAGAGYSASIVNAMSIPSGSSLTIIGKDNPFYIEENQSIGATCTNINSIDILVSYEEVS